MSDVRKRRRDDSPSGDRSEEWVSFRLLCPSHKSGHIIGKGGEIVKKIRADTGATIRIDDQLRGDTERVVTISAREQVGELYCPAQEALFRVLEKLYEEFTDSSEEVQVRILIDRSQTGGVIGKDGKIIKELRDTSGANIKIFNSSGKPACASQYEDLLQISGPFADALHGCKLTSERLRQTTPKLHPMAPQSDFRPPPRMPPSDDFRPPPSRRPEIPLDNPALVTEGFIGPVETEFRLLVPESLVGCIIGKGGKVVKMIRDDTGAKVVLSQAPEGAVERVVECVSLEPAESRFVAAIEAVLQVLNCVFGEERTPVEHPMVRMLLPSTQVGAVLGKGGSTIKQIRQETGTQVLVHPQEVVQGGREGDEVLQIEGPPPACINAIKIVTMALRGHMIRTQAQPLSGPPGGAGRVVTLAPGHPGRRFDGPPGNFPPHMSGMPMGLMPPPGDFGPPRGPPPGLSSVQTTSKMNLSDHQVGMLLGNRGANINQIRKVSGARVKLHEDRSMDGDRELEVSGSLEQAQAAQNMISQVLAGINLGGY